MKEAVSEELSLWGKDEVGWLHMGVYASVEDAERYIADEAARGCFWECQDLQSHRAVVAEWANGKRVA